MATLMLGTVFEETKHKYQLKLLAGAEGLHRSLRWLYFSEDIGNAEFLRGGELMVITGFGLQDAAAFEQFLRMLIQKNCCGVILNIGKYIMEENIPPEILALCDAEQLPLISMPWNFHLADIMQEYSRQIFFRTHEQDRINDIFQLTLTDRKLCSEEDEARLAAHHFLPDGAYCVAQMSWRAAGKTPLLPELPRKLHVLVENHLNQTRRQLCVFPYQDDLVLIAYGESEEMLAAECARIVQLCEAAFPSARVYCGIGSKLTGLSQLRESHQRAGLALLCAGARDCATLRFADTGIYQLFFTCRDPAVLRQFSDALAPLETHDAQYDSQLMETLRLYLQFSGSVNLVSDEMYCHRNTTNYRIKKIKSLLGIELDRREALFSLQLAFFLREYQTLQDNAT